MKRTIERTVLVLVLSAPLWGATALAQKVRDPVLRGNPYRNIGGSCVYGRDGELVYAPAGSRCRPHQEASGEEPAPAVPTRQGNLSLAVKAEMSALLAGHSHVAAEIEKLRRAVAAGRKDEALEASSHVVQELANHLAREALLFQALAAP